MPITIRLDQTSFALSSQKPESKVSGVVHISSIKEPLPSWTQIQLIGQEKIQDLTYSLLDDTYQLSSKPQDWLPSAQGGHDLPFSVSIPSNIPNSFHCIQSQLGISYTIKARTASDTVSQPIHFHRSSRIAANVTEKIPKRVCWGIANQSKQQRWQYELEFANTVNLSSSSHLEANVRLKSMFPSNECCLVGYQIVQAIHIADVCQSVNRILAADTRLLISPNHSWSEPCQFSFDISHGETILPTVTESQKLSVEHYVKFTFAFCNPCTNQNVNTDLEFPMELVGQPSTVSSEPNNNNSSGTEILPVQQNPLSRCSSLAEVSSQDSAIDVLSFKSLWDMSYHFKTVSH